MKKVITLLLLFFIFSSVTFAQHTQKFGITVGANYSNFRGMDVPDVTYDYAPGIVVGITSEYYFNNELSIKANMFYDAKSSKGSTPIIADDWNDPAFVGGGTINFKFTYHYITLPVLLKYEFRNCRGFFINGGPFFGYLLDSEFVLTASSDKDSKSLTESTYYYNNKFDFGITTGFGKSFKIDSKNSLVLEFRNNYGLFQTNKNNTFDGNEVKSNSYNLLLGWTTDL